MLIMTSCVIFLRESEVLRARASPGREESQGRPRRRLPDLSEDAAASPSRSWLRQLVSRPGPQGATGGGARGRRPPGKSKM